MNPRRAWRRSLGIGVAMICAVTVTLLAWALAGCGDGEGESSSSTSASTSTTVLTSSTTASTSPTSVPVSSTIAPTSSTSLAGGCSAARQRMELLPQLGLPEPVKTAREAIYYAATACDYKALESQALAGPGDFTYSFGGADEGPAAYWRAAEERGEPVLATLVAVLNMPYGREDGMIVWPFAHSLDFQDLVPDLEDLLSQFFPPEDIEDWVSFGGYLGYRVGITESGDWMFFVAGD